MLLNSKAGAAGSRSIGRSAQRAASVVPRATAPASKSESSSAAAKYVIHEIPNNGVWPNGVPPVMGAHLMASGVVAPVSTSKGAGVDVYPIPIPYYDKEGEGHVILHATSAAASTTLARAIFEASEAAIKAKGSFTLVLSGGSLVNSLTGLINYKQPIQWNKFHVFWVDERNVPHSSPDSNYKGALDALLSKVPIPASQIHAILENVTVQQAATNYEGRLLGLPASILPRNSSGLPVFDLILLGVGPDGHVASLFPNKAATFATSGWVLPVENSPKPPPERITFSLPVINAAKEVHVVALGESKAEVVQRALEVQALPGSLPVQLVRPTEGKLKWLLDVQSAQFLDIASWGESKLFPRSQ
mmetsp:Transcript_40156/g.89089  ORF Transcript_40156/g.89089 Transcript_40156/m.89089 type:complete len:360 (+) Transcript_40156:81-1160(+)